jgi:hypothetical protein
MPPDVESFSDRHVEFSREPNAAVRAHHIAPRFLKLPLPLCDKAVSL